MSLEYVIKFINTESKKIFEDRLNKYGNYIIEKREDRIKLKSPISTHSWDNDITLFFNNGREKVDLIVNSQNFDIFSLLSKCLEETKFMITDEDGDIYSLENIFAIG